MAAVYGHLAFRKRDCDRVSSRALFVVAAAALVLAVLAFFQILSAVIGYSLVCLTLVCYQLFDLLQNEHDRARRRRVALLAPRPAAEAVPTVWVALAVACASMVAPYVLLGEQRAAALIVAVCALVMAGISWRIASAPVQLFGENVRSEQMRDRASRTRKAGVTAVVAMGSIMVFIVFVNSGLPAVTLPQRALQSISWFVWILSSVWVMWYSTRLERLANAST